ncbi:protein of unknown function [Micropruina glycogenica]|uniref:Uncharacterized protein n=1 Tax=Micropruina glycogenica TaxID=75385 RepID=A0A2N9JEK4_9ACTN|nr:protein of unknown function [Micropruina glycogenica]
MGSSKPLAAMGLDKLDQRGGSLDDTLDQRFPKDALIFVVCGSVAGFGCWDAKLLGYGQRAAFFRRCRVWQSSAGFQA